MRFVLLCVGPGVSLVLFLCGFACIIGKFTIFQSQPFKSPLLLDTFTLFNQHYL